MFEKDAEEYAKGKGHEHYNHLFEENAGSPADFAERCFQDGAEFGYDKAKEELKEENRLLGERCNQLLKDKGDLTDKCRKLEQEIVNLHETLDLRRMQLDDSAEIIKEMQSKVDTLEKENAELKRLRCCENCKNVSLQLHWKESKDIDERRQFVCGTCGNRKHWEYSGNTIGITETQQLTKAKEILKMIVDYYPCYNKTITEQAEQFLKEIEK